MCTEKGKQIYSLHNAEGGFFFFILAGFISFSVSTMIATKLHIRNMVVKCNSELRESKGNMELQRDSIELSELRLRGKMANFPLALIKCNHS